VDALAFQARLRWGNFEAGNPMTVTPPAPPTPEAAGPVECQNCGKTGGRVERIILPGGHMSRWTCPHCRIQDKKPEAAGPGLRHIFRCTWSAAGKHGEWPCGEECPCVECGREPMHLNHAVPPIPEGGAR